MNTSKSMLFLMASLVAILIDLLLVQLLVKRLKPKSENEGRLKLSYAIWFAALFTSAAFVSLRTLSVLMEAIDNIFKLNAGKAMLETGKTASLYIGLSAIWYILWYFFANLLSPLITGKRNARTEMEADNYGYFMVRGILVIAVNVCLLSSFEILLRAFMPSAALPFYH